MDAAIREFVRQRAGGRCEYCLLSQRFVAGRFHVEHVIARQHLIDDSVDNLALACDRCNLFKGPNLTSIDPETGRIVELFHPRRDPWSAHFRLSGARILGLTPTGRASARLLHFNAKRRVELRAVLLAAGGFPGGEDSR